MNDRILIRFADIYCISWVHFMVHSLIMIISLLLRVLMHRNWKKKFGSITGNPNQWILMDLDLEVLEISFRIFS